MIHVGLRIQHQMGVAALDSSFKTYPSTFAAMAEAIAE